MTFVRESAENGANGDSQSTGCAQEAPDINIKDRKKGNVVILQCSGAFKLGAEVKFRERINAFLDAHELFFIFDLSDVSWIDTVGITEIIAAQKHVSEKEGKIVLVLSKKVRDILTVTQLLCIFDLYDDLEEALGSFAK